MKVLLFIALLGCVHSCYANAVQEPPKQGSSSNNESVIVGGWDALINEFPYAVHIQAIFFDSFQDCDGVLLSHHHVLSVAHCFPYTIIRILLFVGSSKLYGGNRYESYNHTNHPQYVHGEVAYDATIITPTTPIIFYRMRVKPAVLVLEGSKPPTDILTVAGWGKTSENARNLSETLKAVKIYITNHEKCVSTYRGEVTVTAASFCAGNLEGYQGICTGDGGGPAKDHRGQVVGIVAQAVGCAKANYPAIYTDISAIRHWIKTVTGA